MSSYSWELLLLLVTLVFSSAASRDVPPPLPPRSQDVLVAIEEMKAADYFTFVTLINMTPPDLIQGNVTFFMPKDRMLSMISLAQEDVPGFLLRHLIPSPLLLDHLLHIPTGSIIPTSAPDYIMRIDNRGRRNLSLNDVKLVSPNICVAGSSIRCHGIDGVLPAVKMPSGSKDSDSSSPSCSASFNNTPIPAAPTMPLLPSPSAPPSGSVTDQAPSPTVPFPHRENSSCPRLVRSFLVASSSTFTLVAVGFLTWVI